MKGSREFFAEKQRRSAEEIRWCKEASELWWVQEKEHIMRIADEVMRHEFIFDLPWDMEQTSEAMVFGDEIDWGRLPKEDHEFIFQMNRNRYWICLGQAYAMTENEDYAKEYVSQLLSWINRNPLTEETRKTTWRTIEAGIRGEYWVKAMGYFVDSPWVTEHVWEAYEQAMLCHGDYLLACDVPFSIKSNWGVLENHGLYMIGAAFGRHPRSEVYQETAVRRLVKQASIQIMEDGVQWEQSPMYHNEVLKCYMEVLRTAKQYGEQLPECIYETVRKMAYANLIWMKPNDCQPAGGDSDETGVRDVLTACALLLNDEMLKFGGYSNLDFESIWDFGSEGAKEYKALQAKAQKETFYAMSDSGNWYLRSGWDAESDYMHFRCGSLGGGHGHFDKLHVDLSLCGEDILVDPGRYTYVPGEDRYELKSAKVHNTAILDDGEYTKCLDAWGVTSMTLALNQGGKQRGNYTYMHGGHLGYLKDGIFVNRRIVAIGTRIYIIMDEFLGSGVHSYTQTYHFNSQGTVSCDDSHIYYHGKRVNATFHTVNSFETSPSVNIFKSRMSRHYNQIEDSYAAKVSCHGAASASMITVITGNEVKEKTEWRVERVPVSVPVTERILSNQEAEAIRIECRGQAYLVLFSHVETGTDCEYIGACGVSAVGQVMVCDLMAETPDMTVLHW